MTNACSPKYPFVFISQVETQRSMPDTKVEVQCKISSPNDPFYDGIQFSFTIYLRPTTSKENAFRVVESIFLANEVI